MKSSKVFPESKALRPDISRTIKAWNILFLTAWFIAMLAVAVPTVTAQSSVTYQARNATFIAFGDGFSSTVGTQSDVLTDNAVYFAVRRDNGVAESLDLQAWFNATYNVTANNLTTATNAKNFSITLQYCNNLDISGAFACTGISGGFSQNPLAVLVRNVSSGQYFQLGRYNSSDINGSEQTVTFSYSNGGMREFIDSQGLFEIRWTINVSIIILGADTSWGADVSPLTVTYDNVVPNWSANVSSPASPVIYLENRTHSFNVSWSDFHSGISRVFNENNFSGTFTNYSLVNTSNVYPYSVLLGAGNYSWRTLANDTAGNRNSSPSARYDVLKALAGLNLSVTPSTIVQYNATTTAVCSLNTSQIPRTLSRNGTIVSSPDVATLGSGVYNYSCSTAGNQNFSAASQNVLLTVLQASYSVNITANGGGIVTYNTSLNISCQGNQSQRPYNVMVNGTNVTNPFNDVLGAGVYNVSCTAGSWQNYSATSQNVLLTVLQASYSVNITANGGGTVTYPSVLNISCQGNQSVTPYVITVNGSNVTNPFTDILGAGVFNASCTAGSSQNYSSTTASTLLTVNKGVPVLDLFLNGTTSNLSVFVGDSVNLSANWSVGAGVSELLNNGSLVLSGVPWLSNITAFLTIGLYNITLRHNGSQNFSASSVELFVDVLVIPSTPPAVIPNLPADGMVQQSPFVNFSWTATDDDDTMLSCSLMVNSVITNASVSSPNNSLVFVGFTVLNGNQTYRWNVSCIDDFLNKGNSSTRGFTIGLAPSIPANETIIGTPFIAGVCPTQSVQSVIFFGFVGFLLLGMFVAGMFVLKLPFLAILSGIGMIMYSFTMFGCDTVIGYVVLIFGVGMIVSQIALSFAGGDNE